MFIFLIIYVFLNLIFMSKKSTQEEENLIEEINLDEIVFEEETEEKLEPTEDDLWEEELSLEEDYE